MTKPNNPPAFPCVKKVEEPCGANMVRLIDVYQEGMTLRDYFAGHAPKDIIWNFPIDISDLGEEPTIKATGDWKPKQRIYEQEVMRRRYVSWPYVWADAMLAEREKSNA